MSDDRQRGEEGEGERTEDGRAAVIGHGDKKVEEREPVHPTYG
jgi:hypothetical protein